MTTTMTTSRRCRHLPPKQQSITRDADDDNDDDSDYSINDGREGAPRAKFKGNHSKQATTVETPLRDGCVKHCFVQSEQRKAFKCHVFRL